MTMINANDTVRIIANTPRSNLREMGSDPDAQYAINSSTRDGVANWVRFDINEHTNDGQDFRRVRVTDVVRVESAHYKYRQKIGGVTDNAHLEDVLGGEDNE